MMRVLAAASDCFVGVQRVVMSIVWGVWRDLVSYLQMISVGILLEFRCDAEADACPCFRSGGCWRIHLKLFFPSASLPCTCVPRFRRCFHSIIYIKKCYHNFATAFLQSTLFKRWVRVNKRKNTRENRSRSVDLAASLISNVWHFHLFHESNE